ncbi:MAG: hypothetical protein LBN20_03620, partial [Endomicrobium sp.]|nr:hypothetical protein [Endomicrobium sp.]
MYKVNQSVFYRQYGDNVVLYQTKSRKAYLFNSIVKDILDCIKKNGEMQSILEQLRAIYAVENNLEFETGIKDFIAELEKSEIISKAYKHKEKSQPIENTIMDAILKTGSLSSVLMELTYRCNEKCRHCYVVND